MAQLLLHRDLQTVITRTGRVLPDSQSAEIWIQPSARVDWQSVVCGAGVDLTKETAAQIVGYAGSFRQAATRQPVLVVCPEQVASHSADIIDFHHQFAAQFTLNASEPVLDEGIAQSLL